MKLTQPENDQWSYFKENFMKILAQLTMVLLLFQMIGWIDFPWYGILLPVIPLIMLYSSIMLVGIAFVLVSLFTKSDTYTEEE